MMTRFAITVMLAIILVGNATPASAEELVGTFTLDGLSFISFGDQQILLPGTDSTIKFRFGTPAPDGSVPFTISPADVSIAPIPLAANGGTLRYSIVSMASGSMIPTTEGRKITFNATVRAELTSNRGTGSYDYAMPFSTENAAANDTTGSQTVSVSGMRLVDGIWYGQIVGATTNKTNAFPEPGSAVYTVLSGQFDQIP